MKIAPRCAVALLKSLASTPWALLLLLSSHSRWWGLPKQRPFFLLSLPPSCSQGCLLNAPHTGARHSPCFRNAQRGTQGSCAFSFPFLLLPLPETPFSPELPRPPHEKPLLLCLLGNTALSFGTWSLMQYLPSEVLPGWPLLVFIILYCRQGHLTTGHWAQCLEPTILLGVLENVLF